MWRDVVKTAMVLVLVALFVGSICIAEEATDGKLIGCKTTKKYHKADCPAVKKMKEDNKVAFASEEEAQKAEMTPCKKCFAPPKAEGEKKAGGEAK